MKKLNLKMKDLTNPTILTHHEIRNITGGSGEENGECTYTCDWEKTDGTHVSFSCASSMCILDDCQSLYDAECLADDTCVNVDCRKIN